MYNGFWVKIIIENLSSTKEMGIQIAKKVTEKSVVRLVKIAAGTKI